MVLESLVEICLGVKSYEVLTWYALSVELNFYRNFVAFQQLTLLVFTYGSDVGAHSTPIKFCGPNTGRNSGGRRIIIKKIKKTPTCFLLNIIFCFFRVGGVLIPTRSFGDFLLKSEHEKPAWKQVTNLIINLLGVTSSDLSDVI